MNILNIGILKKLWWENVLFFKYKTETTNRWVIIKLVILNESFHSF